MDPELDEQLLVRLLRSQDLSVRREAADRVAPRAGEASVRDALGAALASGALRPVVGLELPLAEAAEAHRRVMAPGARGKIVLLMP